MNRKNKTEAGRIQFTIRVPQVIYFYPKQDLYEAILSGTDDVINF